MQPSHTPLAQEQPAQAALARVEYLVPQRSHGRTAWHVVDSVQPPAERPPAASPRSATTGTQRQADPRCESSSERSCSSCSSLHAPHDRRSTPRRAAGKGMKQRGLPPPQAPPSPALPVAAACARGASASPLNRQAHVPGTPSTGRSRGPSTATTSASAARRPASSSSAARQAPSPRQRNGVRGTSPARASLASSRNASWGQGGEPAAAAPTVTPTGIAAEAGENCNAALNTTPSRDASSSAQVGGCGEQTSVARNGAPMAVPKLNGSHMSVARGQANGSRPIHLDLSAVHRADMPSSGAATLQPGAQGLVAADGESGDADEDSEPPGAKSPVDAPTDGLRAALKLNLAALNEAHAPALREARPAWAFDYSEVTLGHRIGAGAFGEVYQASWRRSRIAVKRLLCQRLTESARGEFMQEMEIMSNLRHPNIVRFLGACLEPLQMSILFELCATSLYEVLHVRKQELTMEYAITLTQQIGLGIFYLHQCKLPVLHLDLKSANVLLDEHGVAKVCDFGLSHIKKETAVITARMGSPQWSAPEILRGQPHDESADTYSFGVLLYEIMSRRLPYTGVDTFQVVMGVITRMLARPELPQDCAFPQQLQELMRTCWCEEPAGRPRFNQILDVVDDVAEQLSLRPQLARSTVPTVPSDAAGGRIDSLQAPAHMSPPGTSSDGGSGMGRAPTRAVAIALIDYVSQNQWELSFKRGDTIRDVQPARALPTESASLEDGWLRGELRGRSGVIRSSHVCMSSMPDVGGGVQHSEAALQDEYDMTGATLLRSGCGYESIQCTKPFGHGAPVVLTVLRTDGAWASRAESQVRVVDELTATSCGHMLPLLRVVRPAHDDRVALVAPYMRGGDLLDRLERLGPLPEALARRVAAQLMGALAHMHKRGYLHGNLRPAAVLFEERATDNATLRLGERMRA